VYNCDAHLARLEHSAATIGIRWAAGMEPVRNLALETARIGGQRDCSIRIILSRGPGSYGVSPYESPSPALYIVIYALGTPFMEKHPEGATVRRSTISPKPAGLAAIKNCNYLPNVLMKKESQDWGVDYVVGYDADGHLTEGPTENAGIVTPAGELVFPRLENILAGTTMLRLVDLVKSTPFPDGTHCPVAFRDITEDEVRQAREMLIVGTTINVVAVRAYAGQPIGDGRPGPVARLLNAWLEQDIHGCAAMRTAVFPANAPAGASAKRRRM